MTVTFTATHTESIVFDEGYQVNDLETLTNNMVTLSGGGPNLLGSTWQYRFAAPSGSSNSYTFNDGTLVPALGFGGAAQTNPLNMDTFYQIFATVPGKSLHLQLRLLEQHCWLARHYEFAAHCDARNRSGAVDLGHVASRLRGTRACRLSCPPCGGLDRVI